MRRLLTNASVKHKIFPDHHAYTAGEARALAEEYKLSRCDHFVVTAKDAVKLRRFPELRDTIWRMDLAVQVQGDVNELDREIDRLVRPRV